MKKKGIVFICIFLLIAFLIIFLIVKNNLKNNDDISKVYVKNGLSINYLNGDEVVASTKEKEYVFSITNDTDLEKYYQVEINDVTTIDEVSYSIFCAETNTEKKGTDFSSSTIVDYAVIMPGETHTYTLKVSPVLQNLKIGQINIEEHTFAKEYFAQTVISNSTIYQNSKTEIGVEISQTDEGLIQDLDDDGVTYYFRGNVMNNYFKFADRMWRIVRINGNNTVRVVLDNTADEQTQYYSDSSENYFYFNNSVAKIFLNNWYDENLKSYDKYIFNSKVCDDNKYTGNDEYVFEASQRLAINHNPTFNCLGSKISSKIFLLTADEVEYAGGLIGQINESYYLYNGEIVNPSWTMTPAKGNNTDYYPYTLNANGLLEEASLGKDARSVRPVINIVKTATVSGDGTINNPYIITN